MLNWLNAAADWWDGVPFGYGAGVGVPFVLWWTGTWLFDRLDWA